MHDGRATTEKAPCGGEMAALPTASQPPRLWPHSWLAAGALVGICQAGEIGPGAAGLVVGVLSGAIVFLGLGSVFALVGFRSPDAVWGAALGGLAAFAFCAMAGDAYRGDVGANGAAMGAIVATTVRPMLGLFWGLAKGLRRALAPLRQLPLTAVEQSRAE